MLELGLVKTALLVSHTMPITDWERAFELSKEKSGLKIVFTSVN